MLLKQSDKHLGVNIHHISYTMRHFSDVLELNSLKADFEYALAYMQGLKQQVYPGLPINCANFSIEQTF